MDSGHSRLPTTIEAATERYLNHYESCYVGSASDMFRLRELAREFILKLRKIAPNFYETKLPQLINQAGSTLLMFNTSDEEQLKRFHETHAYLLLILQDLRNSQPAGEVSFQTEKQRYEERAALIKRQDALAKAIDELEAEDFDLDEVGEDDGSSNRVFDKLEVLKKEQRAVNMTLAILEGLDMEEKPDFKLVVKENSTLSRLEESQLDKLEQLMSEYCKPAPSYPDEEGMNTMLSDLDLDESLYPQEVLVKMRKEILDLLRLYYREKDQAYRNRFHEELLENEVLRPREGIIIEDPNDLPEELERQLSKNFSLFQRETEKIYQEFCDRQDVGEATGAEVDECEEGDDREDHLETTIKSRSSRYARVIETPRDDYIETEDY